VTYPPRYRVEETERAEAEREAAFLRMVQFSPDYAGPWHDGLLLAIASLPNFPGPLSHPVDESASALYGVEVRRMLYFGPTRRRSGTPYRVLFTLVPPAEGEENIILVLRVLHGARLPLGEDQKNDDQEDAA
jgi:plasmid stabilization system protein ParE